MNPTPTHRIRALLATLLVLALAVCMPRAAHPSSIIEFGTRCFNGDTLGSFIEITGVAGESTRNGMRLRAYDRNGTLLFDMDAYGKRGTEVFNFQEGGRHFLLVTAPMVQQLGFSWGPVPLGYADNILPFALDPVAGRLQLYVIINNREQNVSLVPYGPGQLAPAPLPGLSAAFGTGNWGIEPNPILESFFFSNPSSVHPETPCFASPEYHMSGLRLQCENGSTDGQYVEVEGFGPIGNLHETVSLLAFDHTGALIGSTTQAFTSDPSAAAFGTRHWLMVGPGFVPGGADTADARLPFTLDPVGGRIQISVTSGIFSWLTDNFIYGTSFLPVPAPGVSYVRDSGLPLATRVVSPRNSSLATVEFPECGAGTGAPRPVVQELALACTDGLPQGQFVELSARGSALPMTSEYSLRHLRRDGSLAFTLANVFANAPAPELERDRTWLLVPASDPHGLLADRQLPDTLDRVAGAIEIWRATLNGDSLVMRLAYGDTPQSRPPDGGSLEAGTITPVRIAYPTPLTYARTTFIHDDCTADRDPVTLSVLRSAFECTDGSRDAAFAELDRLTPALVRDTRLGLRVLNGSGGELASIEPLFPARSSWDLSNAPHWLAGSPRFQSRTGLAPDATWTVALTNTPSSLQLFRRDPVSGAITTMSVHPLIPNLLTAGHGEIRTSSGQYESDVLVSPRRFDGARVASGTCWTTPHPEAARLAAVFLQCRATAAAEPPTQYVQLTAENAESMYSADLTLRWFGHTGALLGEKRAPFPAESEGRSWPLGTMLVVGSPTFASTFGVSPDATLPSPLDTLGGRIELVLAPVGQPEIPLDAFDYGDATRAVPPAGAAWVATNGTWHLDAFPRVTGMTLSIAAPTPCLGECPGRRLRLSLGGTQALLTTSGHITNTGVDVTYDGAQGTFEMATEFQEVTMVWNDRYVVEGVPAGTVVPLRVRVRNTLAHRDSCLRGPGGCVASEASVTLSNTATQDSVSSRGTARDVLLPLSVPAGESFDLLLSLRTAGVGSPALPASARARLEFLDLPAGAYVRSCHGFDSRDQRGVGEPVVTAEARRITVAWPVTGDVAELWNIDRRVDDGDWLPLETRQADADHVLRLTDSRVSPGHRYAYRVEWEDEFGSYASSVASSQAPVAPGYGFSGITPNPSTGAFNARFEIPESGTVQLEVIDVAGRVLTTHTRNYAAGRYVESLTAQGALPAGVYTVRMKYRGLVSWSRVVVLH